MAGMRWFRLYSEARNDAKLRSLTDGQHRIWFNLMCYAGEFESRGLVPIYDEELLSIEVANSDIDLLKETVEKLKKLRIITIEDNTIVFINWNKRQYDKPSDRPEATKERKQKSRQLKKQSHDVTPSHATYTDTEQIQNRTDTEKEAEAEEIKDTDFAEQIENWTPEEPSEPIGGGFGDTDSLKLSYRMMEQEFARPLSPMEIEEIAELTKESGFDLLKYAVRIAVSRRNFTLKYVRGILRVWKNNSITTLHNAVEYEEAYEKAKASKQQAGQQQPDDPGKVVQLQAKRSEEKIKAACDFIRLQCGLSPPRERAAEIAREYGEEIAPAIIDRLYGGASP